MKKRTHQQFNHPIHLVCDDSNYRENLAYVYFRDGKAYATDTHICVILDLSETNLKDWEIELLNNKMIRKNQYAKIYNKEVAITPEGILITELGCLYKIMDINDTGNHLLSLIGDVTKFGGNELLDEIAFEPKLLYIIQQAFKCRSVRLVFYAKNKAIKVNPQDGSRHIGILMPTMIMD